MLGRQTVEIATSCGEHYANIVLSLIRRRFVPALATMLTFKAMRRVPWLTNGSERLIKTCICWTSGRPCTGGQRQSLTRSRKEQPSGEIRIHHMELRGGGIAICCAEQRVNPFESVIRRRFVPDSFQRLTDGTFAFRFRFLILYVCGGGVYAAVTAYRDAANECSA